MFRGVSFRGWITGGITTAFAVLAFTGSASALSFDLGPDAGIDMDTTIKYGAGWRQRDQADELIANANADDGNRNFDKGDMVNNRFTVTMDFDAHWNDYGVFVRPRYYYDFAYMGDNANDSPATNNAFRSGAVTENDQFHPDTEDLHGEKFEVLDAFAYADWYAGGHNVNLRIGRQVVSWGESLFLQGGISSAMSPLDATMTSAPGTELKDIFLPVGQVYTQFDIVPNVTLAGFYQWEWDKTRLDASGAYFSTNDLIDEGGEVAVLGPATIDRLETEEADDQGQWGAALRFNIEALNNSELGLYYINYHDKVPMLKANLGTGGTFAGPAVPAIGGDWNNVPSDPTDPTSPTFGALPGNAVGGPPTITAGDFFNMLDYSSYYTEYQEDIKLIGASYATVLGETNVGMEVSYRQDAPIALVDAASPLPYARYELGNIVQAQMSIIHFVGPLLIWDNSTLMAEVGGNRVNGYSSDQLFFDKYAWGGAVKYTMDFYQIMTNLDLAVPVNYKFNPDGVSSVLGTFAENGDSVSINFDFTYDSVYKLGFGYVAYLNSPALNAKADRDYYTFTASYTF